MNQVNCKIWGRPLKSINSIMTGIGPVCGGGNFHAPKRKKNVKEEGDFLFNEHASFSIEANTNNYVYIIDNGHDRGYRTVTNDAKFVVSELSGLIDDFINKRLFYLDSDNRIDEIIHNGKSFIRFKAGHEGVTL